MNLGDDSFSTALIRRIQNYRLAEFKAERRAKEAANEAERMRSRREAAERLYEAEFGELPSLPVPATPPPRSTHIRSKTPRSELPRASQDGPLTGLHWQDAIRAALQDGEPAHVREIWGRLVDGGFRTDARDPLRSIVAVAIRAPDVVRAGPNTYALADGARHRDGSRTERPPRR